MINPDSYVAISPQWVLRNDGRKVILYLLSNTESRYLILDPETAITASLLDGQTPVVQLMREMRFMFNLPSNDVASSILSGVIESLLARSVVQVSTSPIAAGARYNPAEYVVPWRDYRPEHRLASPLTLMILFARACQTNCVYCYADLANLRKLRNMPVRQWTRILEEARSLDIRLIQLTGGDPLARPDSISFLQELLRLGFLFLVSTKCPISPDGARLLASAGFNEPVGGVRREFQLSIDTPIAATADFLVGRHDYLPPMIQSVKSLLAAGIEPRVKAVLTPYNWDHVEAQVESFEGLGVQHLQFSFYSPSHYRHDPALTMTTEMKNRTADRLQRLAEDHPELTISGDATLHEPAQPVLDATQTWANRAGCSAGRTNLGIAPDGHAILCEQTPLEEAFFVGDLTKQSIREVWNSPEVHRFVDRPRDEFIGTSCFDCEDFENCITDVGYCWRDTYFATGDIAGPPPSCPRS